MVGDLYVVSVEHDTLAGLAAAIEAILNVDHEVLVENAFPPTLTLTRGQNKNLGGHIMFYVTPT